MEERISALEELREYAETFDSIYTRNLLLAIADRIEAEWMELPRDSDGEVIHVGDTVRYLDDKDVFQVYGITFNSDGAKIIEANDGVWSRPNSVSHVKPDSWLQVRIDALKLDDMVNHGISTSAQHVSIVERCKALAGVDDE